MSGLSGRPLPAPECIDVSSVTPDSVKSPTPPTVVSNAPDASGANSNATPPDRSGSPPPSCPICLGSYKNKCFTDSCLHQFCFNCLLEWSKIKAECPLCKQAFKSIIHNVKSEQDFEEYMVQQPLHRHYNLMLSEPFRFSYSTTLQVRPSQSEAIQRLFLHHPSLTDRYVYSRNDTPNVRRRIYERGLYALPLFDITGRARECSAEFYRNNQAQMHRLIPFLNREAIHVIQDQRRVSSLLQRATEIFTTHDITSSAFRRHMEPYFRENTVHFIHELYNFARSPYDLYGYDNNVQYSQDYNLALNTVEGMHNENSETNSTRMVRDAVRSALGSVAGSSSSSSNTRGGGAAVPGPSASSIWNQFVPPFQPTTVFNVLSSSSSSGSSSSSEDETAARPSTSAAAAAGSAGSTRRETVSVIQTNPASTSGASSSAIAGVSATIKMEQRVESVIQSGPTAEPIKIELSDTDSDECQFVLERKAPHLRTPEYVSLNSDDEDSDVVFVTQSTTAAVLPKAINSTATTIPQQVNNNLPGPSNTNSRGHNLVLEDSNQMPLFMPYMLGMDVEAGPSTVAAGAASSSAPMNLSTSNKHVKQDAFMGDSQLKREDPMLGASPNKARMLDAAATSLAHRRRMGRRKRSNRRGTAAGLVWSSAEEEESDEEDLPSSSQKMTRSRNNALNFRTEPTTSESEESEDSSHDEYTVSPRSKMLARKRETIKLALTKTSPRWKVKRTRKQKDESMSKSDAASSKRKRHKPSESPVAGSSSQPSNLTPADSGSESDKEEPQNEGRGSVGLLGHFSDAGGMKDFTLHDNIRYVTTTAAPDSDESEDDASNKGSRATSEDPPTTSSPDSESEEIDVQNEDVDDD